jgi:hypothetical protein
MWYLFENSPDGWTVKTPDGKVAPADYASVHNKIILFGELASGLTLFKHDVELATELGLMPVALHVFFDENRLVRAAIHDRALGIPLIHDIQRFTLEDEV